MTPTRADIKLLGDKNLKSILEEFPKVRKPALKAAMTAGTTPIARAARAAMPVESGFGKKAITKKIKSYGNGNAAGIVGANRAVKGEYNGKLRVPANYIHLVEDGAKPHGYSSRPGRHPGFHGKHPLKQAAEAKKTEALNAAEAKLKEVVEKKARQLASRGNAK